MRATRSAAELLVGSSSTPNLHRPGSGGLARPPSAGSLHIKKIGGSDLRKPTRTLSTFDAPGMCKHELAHALGDHGLTWDDTIVTAVRGQAAKKGIRTGWKIYQVDGHYVQNSDDIWMRLQDAKWQWRSAYVTFVTDMAAIRADAARQRAEKIKAEAERLARLPFEGSHDAKHLEQVKEEFKFQGFIDGAENRGVTISQVKRLMAWAGDHCHRWRDPQTTQKLQIESMNLNQMNHWLVKPATKEKDCSFVELLSKEKQTPAWFVVSWWGEKVANMLKCLEAHSKLRGVSERGFWIAAYASRQHSLTEVDVVETVRKSVYSRAMEQTKYKVLLVLDDKQDKSGPATPFTRSWCCYEALVALEEPNVTLDIASVQGGKAIVLTQSLTEKEKEEELVTAGSGYKAKELRERSFSIDIINAGLSINVANTQASTPVETGRVLNMIAGRDPEAEPLEKCEEYDKASKRLQAMFAITCWQRVASVPGEDAMKDLQTKLANALRNDEWRRSLNLSLAFFNGGSEKLTFLERCLPPNLRELAVNLSGMNLADEHIDTFARSLPVNMEDLNINLTNNPDVTNVGVANFMQNIPPKMKQNMNLSGTQCSQEFKDKAHSVDGIKQAIYEESQKGNMCTIVNIVPSGTRKIQHYTVEKSKCY